MLQVLIPSAVSNMPKYLFGTNFKVNWGLIGGNQRFNLINNNQLAWSCYKYFKFKSYYFQNFRCIYKNKHIQEQNIYKNKHINKYKFLLLNYKRYFFNLS